MQMINQTNYYPFDINESVKSLEEPCDKGMDLESILVTFGENFKLKRIQNTSTSDSQLNFITPIKDVQKFYYMSSIYLDSKKQTITIIHKLCYSDGKVYVIQDHQLKLLFCRFVNKINNNERISKFTCNPRNGQISLKGNTFINLQKTQESRKICIDSIKELYIKQIEIINLYSQKILITLEEQLPQTLYDKQNQQYIQPIDLTQLKLNKIKGILTVFDKSEIEESEKKYLDMPIPTQQAQQLDTKILNEIEIIQGPDYVDNINKGGFGGIDKCQLTFKIKGSNVQQTKTLLIKKDKDLNLPVKNISHELQILKQLKNEYNIFIVKYYYSTQYEHILFVEYFTSKSLNLVKAQFSQTMSLFSKVYILWQISLGIKFLASMNVFHLDLNPANIVISKGYNAKIINFGNAYHEKVCDENYKPVKTLPYFPQFDTRNVKSFTYKSDVFSLGIIISEIIFDNQPNDFKKGTLHNLSYKYYLGEIKIKLEKNFCRHNSLKHCLDLINTLINRSLDKKEKRLEIEQVVLSIRHLLNVIHLKYMTKLLIGSINYLLLIYRITSIRKTFDLREQPQKQ